MNPIDQARLAITRRHFFSRASTGIGVAALASLLAEDAQAAAVGGLPGLPHFAPKAKRVIYLFQHGAPSQLDLFDYKPNLARHARRGAAGFHPHGPAPHRHDGLPGEVSHRALDLQVRAARHSGHVAQRTAALHREDRRPHLRSSARCRPRPSITIPRSPFSRPDFRSPAGPASARGSPTAWAARTRICRRSW